MRNSVLIVTLAFLIGITWMHTPPITAVQAAPALPQDFEDVVVTAIGAPTALAFTPDGHLLITTQGGQVRIYQNGTLLATPALNLASRLCTNCDAHRRHQ